MGSDRLFFLDFTRAIAILLIILFHYTVWLQKIVAGAEARFPSCELAGAIGVSLFVILSGASLRISTQKAFDVKEFYRKRIVAIFPLFYVTYLAVLLVYAVFYGKVPFSGAKPAAFLLTIAGLDGFLAYAAPNYYIIGEWFLGFIIIMYGAYPVVRYFFVKSMAWTVIGAAALSLFVYGNYHFEMAVFRFPLIRIFEFVCGMYLVSRVRFFTDMRWQRHVLLLVMLAVGLVVLLRYFVNYLLVKYIVLGLVSFLFLAVFSCRMKNVPLTGFFLFLSRYSYGAFLVHHVFVIRFISANKEYLTSGPTAALSFFAALVCIFFAAFVLTNFTRFLLGQKGGPREGDRECSCGVRA